MLLSFYDILYKNASYEFYLRYAIVYITEVRLHLHPAQVKRGSAALDQPSGISQERYCFKMMNCCFTNFPNSFNH